MYIHSPNRYNEVAFHFVAEPLAIEIITILSHIGRILCSVFIYDPIFNFHGYVTIVQQSNMFCAPRLLIYIYEYAVAI